MFYRWIIFNSITVFISVYLIQYFDALNWLVNNDHTYISLVIAAVYVLTSGFIGYNIYGPRKDDKHSDFISRMCLGLGLIGTVIGMMMIFQSAVGADVKTIIPTLMKGIATAQVTTLFGLGSGWLIDLQNWFVKGSVGDER